MNGLELCKKYYDEIGRPAFEAACPEIMGKAAFGLVGEGSECFGFDDEISKDHDWGPGFCVWLTAEDYMLFGEKASFIYDTLPTEFMGFSRLRQSPMSSGRVGVLNIDSFYERYIGFPNAPQNITEWRMASHTGLSTVTNGEVWDDPLGYFSSIRNSIKAYYPEDLRKKKLAMHAALAAQAGQYNYYRIVKRGDKVAEYQAVSEFISHIQAIVFLLNLQYMPYYKWTNRALSKLPILGSEVSVLCAQLCSREDKADIIEKTASLLIAQFKLQGLSSSESDFLLHHAEEIQDKISDDSIRSIHLMAE